MECGCRGELDELKAPRLPKGELRICQYLLVVTAAHFVVY